MIYDLRSYLPERSGGRLKLVLLPTASELDDWILQGAATLARAFQLATLDPELPR